MPGHTALEQLQRFVWVFRLLRAALDMCHCDISGAQSKGDDVADYSLSQSSDQVATLSHCSLQAWALNALIDSQADPPHADSVHFTKLGRPNAKYKEFQKHSDQS
jgi:hypothetical protein